MSPTNVTRRKFLSSSVAVATVPLIGDAFAQEQPKRGGRLRSIVNPEPPSLMMAINQLAPTFLVASKIYQGLLDYDFKLRPVPKLAESFDVSEDGLTYTFRLRKNVKWHDGQPFTSRDVVFTITEFLSKTHARNRATFGRCKSIEAPDESTVVFTLSSPFPAFILGFDVTTSPMVPAHIYKGTDFAQNPANATPIGTGPFKLKEWAKGQYIHLVRNGDYWRPGLPYLDEIYFRIIPDGASRALALESGEVDLTSSNDLEFIDIKRLSALPDIVTETRGWEFFAPHGFMEINNRVKPLDDKRFRQAMMYAIDRDFIKDKIWYGFGKVATGPIGSRTKFYDGNVPLYKPDLAKSRALLDEMGLKPDSDGIRARVQLLQLPYGDTWVRTAEFIKQSLQRVGVRVDMETADTGGWLQREGNWDYQLTLNLPYQFADPALGVARTYVSSNIRKGVPHTNTVGYVNPKVDELFDKASAAIDEGERQRLYSEVQRLLVEDVPIGWLLELSFPTLHRKKFRNVVTTALGVTADFEETWIAG